MGAIEHSSLGIYVELLTLEENRMSLQRFALFFTGLACCAFQASPPLSAPAGSPRVEDRQVIKIASSSNCGVVVAGSMAVGKTTSSSALITMTNSSAKAIAGVVGLTNYNTSEGAIKRPWHSLYPSPMNKASFFQPGASRSMPGFPENVTSPNGSIAAVTYEVIGVVYGDGSICGGEGNTAREKYLSSMKVWMDVFNRFKAGYASLSPQDLENKLRAGYFPASEGPLANEGLRRTFFTPEGKLASNCSQRLDTVLNRLANPFAD
jgi:hypothetical protein